MVGPEPEIEGNVGFAVIAFEVAVMKLVKIRSSGDLAAAGEDELVEADMALGGGEGGVLSVEEYVERMRGDDPVDQNTTEVE